jgi:predicted Zn-dependent protease
MKLAAQPQERPRERLSRLHCDARSVTRIFASGYAMAAWCYFWRKVNGWMTDRPGEIAEGARLARRAGIALLDRALVLNPNLASAWFLAGFLRTWNGEPDAAIERFAHAMRLSPLDPELYRMQAGLAAAHLFAGRFDAASSWAEKAFRELPSFLMVVNVIAASHALAGRPDEAQRAMKHLRELATPKRCRATHWTWVARNTGRRARRCRRMACGCSGWCCGWRHRRWYYWCTNASGHKPGRRICLC